MRSPLDPSPSGLATSPHPTAVLEMHASSSIAETSALQSERAHCTPGESSKLHAGASSEGWPNPAARLRHRCRRRVRKLKGLLFPPSTAEQTAPLALVPPPLLPCHP